METPTATTSGIASAGENRRPLAYMIVAVAAFSLVPLSISWFDAASSPFLFTGIWRFGVSAGCLAFLCLLYWPLLHPRNLRILLRLLLDWRMALAIVGNCEYALFSWSTAFVNVSTTTMLFGARPIFMILFLSLLFKQSAHFDTPDVAKLGTLGMLGVGVVGVVFLLSSETGVFLSFGDTVPAEMATGIGLAIGAIVLGSFQAFGYSWGADASGKLEQEIQKRGSTVQDELRGAGKSLVLGCVVASFFISSLGASLISLCVGWGGNDTIAPNTAVGAFVSGMVVNLVAGIAWRQANVTTNNLSINVIAYLVPILSLVFLLAFSQILVERFDYLIIGAGAIVAANLLVTFQTEIRWGFKSLILSLLGCGTFVYFRDSIFAFFGIQDSEWTILGYFGGVGLSATLFTLLLAFRVATLVSRSNTEEGHAFSVFRKMDFLVQQGVINPEVRECIVRIDAPRNEVDLKEAYYEARNHITAVGPMEDGLRQMLNSAESELDLLVRSKQLGLVLGELFALIIFAGITVAVTLFLRPSEEQSFIRFMMDVLAMLISAVVIFLTVNVWDLHNERGVTQLERREDQGDYVVRFPDTERRLADQYLSVIVGVAIVMAYAGLLAHKWLGWFG